MKLELIISVRVGRLKSIQARLPVLGSTDFVFARIGGV